MSLENQSELPRIAIVGPCGAGKSTLANALQSLGFEARQIAQEHSFAPAMWQKITRPDILIYLDVSYLVSTDRKQFRWTVEEYSEQPRRLRHARQNCHIYIHTDVLSTEEILTQVLTELDVGHLLFSDV